MSRRRRYQLAPLLLACIAALLVGGCGRASGRRVALRPLPPCKSVTGVTQSAAGVISGCIEVTPLTAGAYQVGLRSFLQTSSGPSRAVLIRKLLRGRGLRLPPPVRLTLRLVPSSGPPGTVITVFG